MNAREKAVAGAPRTDADAPPTARNGMALHVHSEGFASLSIPARDGGLPIEVTLIAQLGPGAGSGLVRDAARRQACHPRFGDALDEPSAKIGDVDFARGDATSLYSFAVGEHGHPFHRHAGHRVFTAVSGSGGAQLRFSTASLTDIERDPACFPETLHLVDVPADCLFTVRFGGGAWHQFAPLAIASGQPALFALSCHTNELGGLADAAQREAVMRGEASIASLTQILPEAAQRTAHTALRRRHGLRRTALSLERPVLPWQRALCRQVRRWAGTTMARLTALRKPAAFATSELPLPQVQAIAPPSASLTLFPMASPCCRRP